MREESKCSCVTTWIPAMCPYTIFFWFLELQWPRYKYIVQVVIGEQKGEGVK